jgi:hypothetical protein
MLEKPTTAREAPEAVELSRGTLLAALAGAAVPVVVWWVVEGVAYVRAAATSAVLLVLLLAAEGEFVKQLESPAPIVKDPDHASVPSSDSSTTATDSPAANFGVQVKEVPWMLSTSSKESPHGLLELTTKAE